MQSFGETWGKQLYRYFASRRPTAPPCRACRDNPWPGSLETLVKHCGSLHSSVVGDARQTDRPWAVGDEESGVRESVLCTGLEPGDQLARTARVDAADVAVTGWADMVHLKARLPQWWPDMMIQLGTCLLRLARRSLATWCGADQRNAKRRGYAVRSPRTKRAWYTIHQRNRPNFQHGGA